MRRNNEINGLTFTMAVLAVVLLALVLAVPGAWLLMLVLGVLHSAWPAVPAFGFWACYLFAWVLSIILRPIQVDCV